MTQEFRTVDVLRLEIEDDPDGLVNLVQNPNGELGGWGWVTPVAGSSMSGGFNTASGRYMLTYLDPPSSGAASYFYTEPMPIAAGEYAAASYQTAGGKWYHRVRFEWLDASLDVLSSTTQSAYSIGGAINYGPYQAPASTQYMRLRFDRYSNTSGGGAGGSGSGMNFFNVTVAKAATSGDLGSSRTNLVPNPSFATDASGWYAEGSCTIARSTAQAAVGSASGLFTKGASGNYVYSSLIPVTGNLTYSVQVRIRTTVTRNGVVLVHWYDADGDYISSSNPTVVSCPSGAWTAVTRNGITAPSNAAYAKVYAAVSSMAASETAYFDAFMLERASTVGTYFDGDTANGGGFTYTWNTHPAKVTSRTNLVDNPSFETNATGWPSNATSTVSRVTTEKYVGNASLQVSLDSAGQFSHVLGPYFDVTPGERYYRSAYVKALTASSNRRFLLGIRWYDALGTFISASGSSVVTATTTAWTKIGTTTTAMVAPANAATGRVWVRLETTNGSNMAAGTRFYLDAVYASTVLGDYFDGSTGTPAGDFETVSRSWDGTAHASSSTETRTFTLPYSTATSSNLAYIEPVQYVNILGPTHDIRVTREALNVGSLEATILDANLDPSQDDLIRPGKRVRLLAYDTWYNEEWTPIFTGKATEASVTYHVKDPDTPEQKRARIVLSAVDATAVLANTQRSEGVATIEELPYVLEGAGVPWNVNGSGDQVPTATVVSRNENASALDQVAITRDTNLGYAWVDRHGVLQVWGPDVIERDESPYLNDAAVTDYDISYNTADCINEVTIRFLRLNPATGETEEVPYGPYRNETSIAEWGVRSAEFTIHGLSEETSDIDDLANVILASNAAPEVRVNAVTLAVRDSWMVSDFALTDLMDFALVDKWWDPWFYENSFIHTIEHSITPEKWLVTYGFLDPNVVASPQFTPSPSTGAGGKTIGQLLRPVGEVTMFYGAKADCPAGWLVLDGSSFSSSEYPALYDLLGSTTLPDFTDRFPIGAGNKALGTSGGSPTLNIPGHTHGAGSLSTGNPTSTYNRGTGSSATASDYHKHDISGSTASGGSHTGLDILNPWRAVWLIIRAV